jgi:peptidyl-prolyl cis-trans isomerase SurA
MLVVCSRQTGGAGVPDRNEIENRLREAEMTMLSDRYLRNLRREATIITRQ